MHKKQLNMKPKAYMFTYSIFWDKDTIENVSLTVHTHENKCMKMPLVFFGSSQYTHLGESTHTVNKMSEVNGLGYL